MITSLLNRVVWNTPVALTLAAVGLIFVAFSIYREWRNNQQQQEPHDHYWNP